MPFMTKEKVEETVYMSEATQTIYGDDLLLFFGGGCQLSNFYPCQLHHPEFINLKFHSVEQALMFSKAALFGDAEILEKLLNSRSPLAAKRYGRKVKGFDEGLWRFMCYTIAYSYNLQKFMISEFKDILLSTRGYLLVESARNDFIWGCGYGMGDDESRNPDKWGLNLHGNILMSVRDVLDPINHIPF